MAKTMLPKAPKTQLHRVAALHAKGDKLTADQIVARTGGIRTSAIHRLGDLARKGYVKALPFDIVYAPTAKLTKCKDVTKIVGKSAKK